MDKAQAFYEAALGNFDATPSLDAALERVIAAGGHVALPRHGLPPGMGFFARITDLDGNRVAYYAPTVTMGGKDRLQSFVSIGVVQPGVPYAFVMGDGFVPSRRDVIYVPAKEAPIAPLLDRFEDDRSHDTCGAGGCAICAKRLTWYSFWKAGASELPFKR